MLAGITAATATLSAQDTVIWGFEGSEQGWQINTVNNDGASNGIMEPGWNDEGQMWATEGEEYIFVSVSTNSANQYGNFFWLLDATVVAGSPEYDLLWGAWQSGETLAFDVVAVDGKGYTDWAQFYVTLNPNTGEWLQIGPVPFQGGGDSFTWQDGTTHTFLYNMATIQAAPATPPENIKVVIAFNSGAAHEGLIMAFDNFRILGEPVGGGDDWLDEFPVDESGWVDTLGWVGWVYPVTDNWAWCADLEGWIYADSVDAGGGWIWVAR